MKYNEFVMPIIIGIVLYFYHRLLHVWVMGASMNFLPDDPTNYIGLYLGITIAIYLWYYGKKK